MQVMVITVKKQVEETVEVNTSTYYKDNCSHHYINDKGILLTVRKTQITVWEPTSCMYNNSIQEVVMKAEPSDSEEFSNAYSVAMNSIGAVLRDDETVNHNL